MTLHFEDFTQGDIFELGQTRVDEQELLQFARRLAFQTRTSGTRTSSTIATSSASSIGPPWAR
jgi:hypothetical protein